MIAAALLVSVPRAPLAAQAASPSAQGSGRALRIEDFYRIRTPGAPLLSPDGRWVAFTVASRDEATNTDPTEVWLAAADASTPARRVSAAGAVATAPGWTDEGSLRWVAGDRGWTLDPASPDRVIEGAWPVPPPASRNAPRGPREITLPAPTGDAVAVLREVPSAPRAAPPLSDFERRHEERFKGVRFDWLDFQRDGQPFPVPDRTDPTVSPPQEIFLSVAGGAERRLTNLGLRPNGLAWSADGTRLVFTADSAYRDERRYGAPAVYSVTRAGAVQRLTPDREHGHSGVQVSPDGKWVLYTRQLSTDVVIATKLDHGGATDLAVVPVTGGEERILTADWDFLPSNAKWSPDGKHVYFSGGVGGTTHLFRVAVAGGAVEQVTKGERRVTGVSFDRAFRRIAYTVGMIEAPAEVWVANIDGTGERRLTTLNDALTAEVALSRAERLQYASVDGTRIEGWLLFPHGYRADAGPYPIVVSSHGGPHSADGYAFDFKSQYFAANGYFVLKTNFRSSTGYGEKFLWATWGAWGDRDGEDVMSGLDHVLGRYPIDRARAATMGHSYGGFMTNWLITQYPDRFAAAIPGAGIVNWVSDYGTADIARTKETEFYGTPWDERGRAIMIRQSPLTYADRVRTPTLFVHGEIDQRVPYSEAEQMFVALKKNGVPAEMIQYEGMSHGITGSWNVVHRVLNERRWLDRWLKGTNTM